MLTFSLQEFSASFSSRLSSGPLFYVLLLGLTGAISASLVVGIQQRNALAVLTLLAGVCWAPLAVASTRGCARRRIVVLALACVTLLCVAVALPPATSKDLHSYILYGRMVSVYHVSPYTHIPLDVSSDPWFIRTSSHWSDVPTMYGPVFTWISAALTSDSVTSFVAVRFGFSLLMALSLLLCVVLVTRRSGSARALVLVGLNPLLLMLGVNDTHVDMLVGVLLCAAGVALLSPVRQEVSSHSLSFARACTGAVLISAAVLVKGSVLPVLIGVAVWLTVKERKRAVVFAGVSFCVLFAGVWSAGGWAVLGPILHASGRVSRFSLWNPTLNAISFFADRDFAFRIVSLAALTACVGVFLFGLLRCMRLVQGICAAAIGLLTYQLIGAYTMAWYAVGVLPLLSLAFQEVSLQKATLQKNVPPLRGEWMRDPRVWFGVAMLHASLVTIAYANGYLASVVCIVLLLMLIVNRATLDGRNKRA